MKFIFESGPLALGGDVFLKVFFYFLALVANFVLAEQILVKGA